MAKKRSQFLDRLGHLALRVVCSLLLALPRSWALSIVHALARLAYHVDRRHRTVAMDNLRRAFPGQYTEEQLRRMTLDVYRHFAKMLLEMLLIPRHFPTEFWQNDTEQTAHARAVNATGRPLILLTAHFGNWEYAAFILAVCGIRAHLVARPIDNPLVDADVKRFRESAGHTVLAKEGSAAQTYTLLKEGGKVCSLADQDAGESGIFVDFFGQPASTHRGIAVLARATNALIVVIGVCSKGDLLDYSLHITDVIDPNEYEGKPEAVRTITQRLTHGVEKLVRLDPCQYFWLHRRWKTQPPASAAEASRAA